MSRYVRHHRRQIFGIGFPLLILISIAFIGIQVFPGWIQPIYSGTLTPCTTFSPDSNNTLLTACDFCAGEFCAGTSCTFSGSTVDCGFGCLECVNTVIPSGTSGFQGAAQCVPDDAFCQDITGGTVGNSCRTGTCVVGDDDDDSAITTPNPSGCDYAFDANDPLCINCLPPLEAANCGNGVCEKPGEDVSNCSIDCRVPGFTNSEPDPNAGCNIPGITFITYPGPPFNDPFTTPGFCEDGDICTDNQCVGAAAPVCDSNPKPCDATTADFCCPEGCTPTTDVDCLTPENCEPTPIPTPTPITFGQVQGSGEAFSCSLNKTWVSPITSAKYFILLAGILATGLFFKRRFS